MRRSTNRDGAGIERARAGGEAAVRTRRLVRPRRHTGRRAELAAGYALVSPVVLYMAALVGYPFLLALYFSVSNATVAGESYDFVGAANFANVFHDPLFLTALRNSLAFTFGAELGKAVLGIGLAFLLLRSIRGKKAIRAFLMLPWTLPISLSVLAFRWMFDPQFSVVNWVGAHIGLLHHPYPDWLGDPVYAFVAILVTNIWRGFPFAAIVVLAGLTSVPQDVLDAARVDGAGFLRIWHHVITPMIAPILFIGLVFDVTFTLGDLTIVHLLTDGGPIGSTEILPTLAFQVGILGGDLGRGAATALVVFPFLLVGVIVLLRSLYRRQEA